MLTNIGVVLTDNGEYEDALQSHLKSLEIFETLKDKEGIAAASINLGVIHHDRGEIQLAIEKYRRALEITEELGNAAGTSYAMNNLGLIYTVSGDYKSAIETLQKSLALNERIGSKSGISQAYMNLATCYSSMGDYDLSLHYLEKALPIKTEIGDARGIAIIQMELGDVFQRKGDLKKAVQYYETSLQQARGSGNSSMSGDVLIKLCAFSEPMYGIDKSLQYCEESLTENRNTGQTLNLVQALQAKASVLMDHGKFDDALPLAKEAVFLSQQQGYLEELIRTQTLMGDFYLETGRFAEAESEFDKAIKGNEEVRFDIPGAERESQLFFEDRLSPYHGMVQLMLSGERLDEALQYAERARARALLDVLQSGRTKIGKNMTQEELNEEQELRNRLVSLNLRIRTENQKEKPDPQVLKETHERASKGRLEWNAFRAKLYAAHPELKIKRGESHVSLSFPGEESKAAYLEYFVTADSTFLFVLKDGNHVSVHKIPGGRKYWRNQSNEFRKMLARRDLGFRKKSMELYQTLFNPALVDLSGKTELVIVPDSGLWEIPFAALLNNRGKFLIENFSISYVPSLTVLSQMKKIHTNRETEEFSLFAAGNPQHGKVSSERLTQVFGGGTLDPLPETEQEVLEVAKFYGRGRSTVLIREQARENTLKKEAGNFDVVHIAAHGILNDASPMYSFILLSDASENFQDGMLEAWEIMEMDWKTRVAILSACETGRGRIAPGEGVIGLSWALFVAGVPSSLLSLWKVDSASTTQLMLEFHKNLAAQKITPARSAQQAALKVLRSENYSHPFFWAGFVLIGYPD